MFVQVTTTLTDQLFVDNLLVAERRLQSPAHPIITGKPSPVVVTANDPSASVNDAVTDHVVDILGVTVIFEITGDVMSHWLEILVVLIHAYRALKLAGMIASYVLVRSRLLF